MASGKVLILTEAGDSIGNGHYSRCSAIRSYFRQKGVATDLRVNLKGRTNGAYDAITSDWINNVHSINSQEYSHVLVDSYLSPLSVFDLLKSQFPMVVALDDYHRIDQGPDLIINPNIFGDKIVYKSRAVGGRDFIILRPSFRNETRKKEINPKINKILITVGGSDVRQLLPGLVRTGMDHFFHPELMVVSGNDDYCKQLRKLVPAGQVRFFGFVGEELMKELMLECDLAISACGQTLHELAWLGVPSIGICVGDDQVLNMKEYVSKGFLIDEINWNDSELHDRVLHQLDRLASIDERRNVSLNGCSAVSSEGLENIYYEIFG